METYAKFDAPDAALLTKWQRIRAIRDEVNRAIEAVRSEGGVGSSLQAEVTLTVNEADHALLAAMGDELKFLLITSQATLQRGTELAVAVTPSSATKCERCWHWRSDVGHDAAHPAICGRCTGNLFGAGESRTVA
jgi:isoleucyl-tRNA synthetase